MGFETKSKVQVNDSHEFGVKSIHYSIHVALTYPMFSYQWRGRKERKLNEEAILDYLDVPNVF